MELRNSGKIRVALHSSPKLGARLIRWQTRSIYSHASLQFPGLGVIESRGRVGVQKVPVLAPHEGETIDTFTVEISATQYEEILSFALAQVGKPYDYTMVARFVSRRQASRKSSAKWFCSELVYAAFQQAGIDLLRDTQPWQVSPGLLARSPLLIPDELNITAR